MAGPTKGANKIQMLKGAFVKLEHKVQSLVEGMLLRIAKGERRMAVLEAEIAEMKEFIAQNSVELDALLYWDAERSQMRWLRNPPPYTIDKDFRAQVVKVDQANQIRASLLGLCSLMNFIAPMAGVDTRTPAQRAVEREMMEKAKAAQAAMEAEKANETKENEEAA